MVPEFRSRPATARSRSRDTYSWLCRHRHNHDLRHTFASHLIIDLRLDVAQVSRILGHARVTTTLDVYTHMFDEARHTLDVRAQMAGSTFADLLERSKDGEEQAGSVITLPQAQERAALRWAT